MLTQCNLSTDKCNFVVLAAAEGGAYGRQDGGGNGAAYLANALVSAAAAGVFILSPETVPFSASPV